MSRYRWLPPSKCLETMDHFPTIKGQSYEAMQKLLHNAVYRGDVKAKLNDVVIPKAHIAVYLNLYARVAIEQEPSTLPPDLALNYDDLCAVFDRPNYDDRKRGRPKQEQQGWTEDQKLAFEMHKMLASAEPNRPKNATQAARLLVEAGRVSGAGAPDNLVKRLVREFRKRYSS